MISGWLVVSVITAFLVYTRVEEWRRDAIHLIVHSYSQRSFLPLLCILILKSYVSDHSD